jgi:hypothetical protein
MPYTNQGWLIIEKLYDIMTIEFPKANIKKANIRQANYPDSGTFCFEISSDTPNTEQTPMGFVEATYTFNIYVYLRFVDREDKQENIIDLAEHLKSFLYSQTNIQNEVWYNSDILGTEYGMAVMDTPQTYLRMCVVKWMCKVQTKREA